MANLKEIKNRITSIASTMQITSAMKMVSAAKLKRAQDAITQMRPYAEKLQEILSNLSATLDISDNAFADQRDDKRIYIVAVTSNRGLCGGFNNNIIKRVNRLLTEHSGKDVKVIAVGKKGNDAFKRSVFNFRPEAIGEAHDMFNDLSFERSSQLAQFLMDEFKANKVDKVVVVYNKFKNAAVQEVISEQYLPVLPTDQEEETSGAGDYIFEPSKEEIVTDLIPKSLKVQLFKAFLDSHASEHGARMTAMHKATDNASELKRALTLEYNKARQAAITNEILEIVGGAEALKNG